MIRYRLVSMVPGKNCPWWLESDDGGCAESGCGLGCLGCGDVMVGPAPATDSMAAPQWRQNRLSRAISREQDRHLNMKGMLPENAEKIDNNDLRAKACHRCRQANGKGEEIDHLVNPEV